MSNQNRSGKEHGFPNLSDFGISIAELVRNNDDPLKSPDRYRCRVVGHEADEVNMPDDDLPFYTAMRSGESSHRGKGKNTRYLPGDKVIVMTIGNDRYIMGSFPAADPQSGEESDTNPYTQDSTASPKSTPPKNKDPFFGWAGRLPSAKKTTREARLSNIKREGSFKDKAEKESRNKYNRTAARFKDADFLSIASEIPFDNTQNPMEFIKKKIGNKGAAMPSMLEMVNTLKEKVDGSSNPHAIQAVGAGNYVNFISQFSSFFKDLIKDQKANTKDARKQERKEAREEAQLRKAYQFKLEEDNE